MDGLELRVATEFEAVPGTFLGGVMEGEWSHPRFVSLLRKMVAICRSTAEAQVLNRRTAAGFWFLDTWLRSQVQLRPFAEQHTPAYYAKALEQVGFVAQWFFEGQCPFENPDNLVREIEELAADGEV